MQDLFHRLEREGFYFGVDTHLRVQTLLREEGQKLRQNPEGLKYLIAPLIAHSAEGQTKFYRVFDEFLEQKRIEAARLFQEGEAVKDVQEEQLKVVRRNTYPKWLVPGVVGLSILLSLLVLWFRGEDPHPIPNAAFHVIRGEKDTLSGNIYDLASDSIAVSAFTSDSIHFHFDPGPDSAGITDSELIWLYGDGTSDTLRYEDNLRAPRHKKYFLEGNYLVRLIVRHRHNELGNEQDGEMDFFLASLNLECPDPVFASIISSIKETDIKVGEPVTFGTDLNVNISSSALNYLWKFGPNDSSFEATPSFVFDKQGKYAIDVRITRKVLRGFSCQDTVYAHLVVEVGADQPSIELTNEFPLRMDDSGIVQYQLSRLSIGLISLLFTTLLLLLGLLVRYLIYKPVTPELEGEFKPGDEGPFSIKLPKQDYLIAADKGVYDLASVMRQRRVGNLEQLNVPLSIHSTIREAGLPVLHFDTNSSATEYLLLIEQHHPQSHLARFFGRITEILQGEDVLLESFYYDGDPRVCWNDSHVDGISLEQLQQRYSKHRLILFTTAHQLVDVYEPKLKPWFVPAFEAWKENRLILTPIPVVDWGYKERLLMEHIDVLPLDIPGQMHMIEMFDEVGQPDFYEHKKRLIEQFPAASRGIKEYDLESVEDLRTYLGPQLFNWLAATAVYPVPNWEVTLAIGHALSQVRGDVESDFLLTFENLLTLARIPWMQSCDLSQRLRMDLLDSLNPTTEKIARQAVLALLAEVRVKSNSHVGHKIAIQKTTHEFFLTPWDQEVAQKMHYLMEQDKLADAATQKRLNREAEILDGKKGKEYLHNLFGFLRPKEYVLGGIIGFALVSLISFGLYKYVGETARSIEWLNPREVKQSIWVKHQPKLDSAMVWNNRAVERASVDDLERADILLTYAMTEREYPLADTNYNKVVYRLGQAAFNQGNYRRAISEFGRMPLEIKNDVIPHMWAGMALSYYHLAAIDSFKILANFLSENHLDFLIENYPNLYAALDIEHGYKYHIDLAKGYFESEEYTSSLTHADSALIVKEGDSLATYWFNRADSALQAQELIADGPLNKDEEGQPEQLGPFVGHKGQITSVSIDDRAGRILSGSKDYTARLWDLNGNILNVFEGYEAGIFKVEVSSDARFILTASEDNRFRVWTQNRGRWEAMMNKLSWRNQKLYDVSFTSGGRGLFVSAEDGATVASLTGNAINFLEQRPSFKGIIGDGGKENDYIIIGTGDGEAKVWKNRDDQPTVFRAGNNDFSIKREKTLRTFKLDEDLIKEIPESVAIDFSPETKRVAVIGSGNRIGVWDANSGTLFRRFNSAMISGPALTVKFSDDGRYLFVARARSGVELWDVERGQSVYSLRNRSLTAATMNGKATRVVIAAGTVLRTEPILKEDIGFNPTPTQQQQDLQRPSTTQEEPVVPTEEKPEIKTNCSADEMEGLIGRISISLAAQGLKYDSKNNADASGIFYRVIDSLKQRCNNISVPDIRSSRSISQIVNWYEKREKFTEITDPQKQCSGIRPGAIMFYGKKSEQVDYSKNESKKGKLSQPSSNKQNINHMGIVISVGVDRGGNVISYRLFHARNANSPAAITTHYKDNGKRNIPPYGNGTDHWLGIAYMIE